MSPMLAMIDSKLFIVAVQLNLYFRFVKLPMTMLQAVFVGPPWLLSLEASCQMMFATDRLRF
jgi:hypothetical protein